MRIFAALFVCSLPCFGLSVLEEMTLEEKAGQVLMAHFHGEVAGEEARLLIQDVKVGAVIYYNWSNGLNSPEQVQSLSADLQKLARENRMPVPLFIAADQEGGAVVRLSKGFTAFPGNRALGVAGDLSLAEAVAQAMGEELRSCGVNLNLAPVVDVNINPKNPVIGVRSFGDNPEMVAAFGEKALLGYHQAGILATLKHFPGHGDVAVDSHEDLPVVRKSMQELEQVELYPFAKLAASADAVMTAHILVPALDAENCSTLSKKSLAYLREKIGFQGLIIADSLVMEGVLKKCQTVDEAAIEALNAGCDLLSLGGKQLIGSNANFELTIADMQRVHRSLVEAVKTGRVAESRLNQAVERILKLKERYLSAKAADPQPLSKLVHTTAHQAIAKKAAALAVKTVKKGSLDASSLQEKRVTIFAPQLLSDSIAQTSFIKIGKSTDLWFSKDLTPSNTEIEDAKQRAAAADVLLVFSYNAWKSPSQTALIRSLLDTEKPVILLAVRDNLDASLFPQANWIFSTFSPTAPSIQAACNQLTPLKNPI